jgi:hypothetical protein
MVRFAILQSLQDTEKLSDCGKPQFIKSVFHVGNLSKLLKIIIYR